ncbi:hypothetical protein GCM10011380_12080 [Sphingomonas metalli]|uniref:OmpA-like domain-containing protein n=1 Tax=Sphingomonas metalli TaxID=1779358 RepID=A0A916SZ89_9SPHN|nr:hypothetical protein [Sphingomonas metalli]GGB23978.1 hypothetical protein GCM10011380_12080 [Sphingomonas metalli]
MKSALLLILVAAQQAAAPAPEVRFIACPVYRDTDAGRKSGCWLADDPASGGRYDVTSAPTKPDWNRAILVEGRAAAKDAGNPCGGTVLDPVRVSVLDQPCTRFMLAADGYAGRRFALPQRNVRPLYETRTPPSKPFAARTITVPFDFGSSFITYQLSDFYLDQAINYALDVQPARITVTGFAATDHDRVSGQLLVEPSSLAKERTKLVTRSLIMRGIPAGLIRESLTHRSTPSTDPAFDGLATASLRRVEVRIEPLSTPKISSDH